MKKSPLGKLSPTNKNFFKEAPLPEASSIGVLRTFGKIPQRRT